MPNTFYPKRKTLLIFTILSFLAFLFFLTMIYKEGTFFPYDAQVSQAMASIQTDSRTAWVLSITNLNGVIASSLLTLIFSLYLLKKKYYSDLMFYLGAFFLSSALFASIKVIISRARPTLKIIDEQGYSFPSGHATMSMTMALALFFIFSVKMKKASHRVMLLVAALLWTMVIVFTRLYLNVHWLSDTLAGVLLGAFCTILVYIVVRRDPKIP